MFVVRRAFKNYGKALLPGSVVEPGNIKSFKTRLRERVIIEVPEQDFDKWNNYFKTKFGVQITVQNKEPAKVEEAKVEGPAKADESTEPADTVKAEDTAKTASVKPVVKVTITK